MNLFMFMAIYCGKYNQLKNFIYRRIVKNFHSIECTLLF